MSIFKTNYTIPLKVFIAYFMQRDTCVKYRIEGNDALFVTELDARLGKQGSDIIAIFNREKYFFKPWQMIQVHGKNLKAYWDHWKGSGKDAFDVWFNSNN